jgi:hypothetical protein
VRSEQDVLQLRQLLRDVRFVLVDVESGARQAAGAQGAYERRAVDQPAARGVYEDRARFEAGEGVVVDQVAGLFGEGNVEGHEVRSPHELVE